MSARQTHRARLEQGGQTERRGAGARPASAVQMLQRTLGNARMAQLRAVQRQADAGAVPAWIRSDLDLSTPEPREADAADEVRVPGGGQPLPAEVQHRAESHLGVGLDDVRLVHDDASCQAADAMAYCAQHDGGGHTIAVSNRVDLGSQDGQFTLAHELSHVAQQKQGRTGALDGLGGDDGVRDALESEADRDAHAMLRDAS